jgi:hypothetical protein
VNPAERKRPSLDHRFAEQHSSSQQPSPGLLYLFFKGCSSMAEIYTGTSQGSWSSRNPLLRITRNRTSTNVRRDATRPTIRPHQLAVSTSNREFDLEVSPMSVLPTNEKANTNLTLVSTTPATRAQNTDFSSKTLPEATPGHPSPSLLFQSENESQPQFLSEASGGYSQMQEIERPRTQASREDLPTDQESNTNQSVNDLHEKFPSNRLVL